MGARDSRHLGSGAPGREALADAERGADHDGHHLDPVVPDHQAQELSVRSLPLPSPVKTNSCLFRPILTQHSLAAVNFFLGVVGVVQCARIGLYHQSQKAALAEGKAEEVKEAVVKA